MAAARLLAAGGLAVARALGGLARHEDADDRDLLGEHEDRMRRRGGRLDLRIGVGALRDGLEVVEQLARRGQVLAGRLCLLRCHGCPPWGGAVRVGQGVDGVVVVVAAGVVVASAGGVGDGGAVVASAGAAVLVADAVGSGAAVVDCVGVVSGVAVAAPAAAGAFDVVAPGVVVV